MPKIPDNRSGENKFIVRGRVKNRSLESLDSWSDKKLEEQLWDQVKSGKRFVEQEQTVLEHKQHQRPPRIGRRKKRKNQ